MRLSVRIIVLLCFGLLQLHAEERKRPRDLGVQIGIFRPGKWNAITDIEGVKVGQTTVIQGDSVRTGVTVVVPHGGNLYKEKVPGAVYVTNGYGKAVGFTQIEELGTIETPIALTNTLCTFTVADAILDYMLAIPGHIGTVNPVVGETNDGRLNDIYGRYVQSEHVLSAIRNAKSGPIVEGSVGAGTGTRALGFKGGIGTSSRILPKSEGGYTVGVLVQTNFGGLLTINGAPVGRELGKTPFTDSIPYDEDEGSCMIIIATDAPLSSRNLKRMAKRTAHAFGRVGSFSANGSGDYTIIFSTHPDVRLTGGTGEKGGPREIEFTTRRVRNRNMNGLFLAVVEATEEAIINSLFMATDVTSRWGSQRALPMKETMKILEKYNTLNWNEKLFPWKK